MLTLVNFQAFSSMRKLNFVLGKGRVIGRDGVTLARPRMTATHEGMRQPFKLVAERT